MATRRKLYAEVLRYSHGKALEKYPLLLDVAADAPPEKKLRAFVHSLLLRIFDKGPTAWHGKLMSREMIEPSAALDSLVEERMRPMAGQLWQIVADILDCPLNDERVRLCASASSASVCFVIIAARSCRGCFRNKNRWTRRASSGWPTTSRGFRWRP